MRRAVILIAAAVSIAALTATFVFVSGRWADGEPFVPPTATPDDLTSVGEARVFFAHQSVGVDIVSALPAVYRAQDLEPPRIAELTEATPSDNLLDYRIGTNGDPIGKIEEFDALIRGGLGDEIDVAVLKLCYIDVREGTDIDALFTTYRDTLAALQRDYPDVTFVAATVPVSVRRGPLGTLKGWLGQGDDFGSEHNVTREQLNAQIRQEYADTNLLFDVAAIQSTTEDGDRVAGTHGGQLYYALTKDYARDAAHLNETGGAVAAESLVAVIGTGLRD
ncbi:hypothetical protein FNH13_03015 [Ornithinimicrobium ciconiae]|uniref:SGNH/GDSL hydrolase family protein n=1 Tax=Ornithinimicrobium ciconiae TaxID=2594265 RepID=A0A516G7C6_9MICO|nr:hypothetical protein [Ornithinimicrobium ciconiae]QDO87431.1 hypothetical protein FNH13_03015 [Ornithinimicrobium ciconiae]